jgi:acyl-CoA dehydrogenase
MDMLNETARFIDEEAAEFARSVSGFYQRNVKDSDVVRWRQQRVVDRELWTKAGAAGLLGVSVPVESGGGGGDFRHDAIIAEETVACGIEGFGISLHNGVIIPYVMHYASDAQKARWLPKLISGELIGAIAMTEPGTGSDLQGINTTIREDGGSLIINGQKTFISNGQTANFVIVVGKTTSGQPGNNISLAVVETQTAPGFSRGRNLEKIGQHAQDTSELFFADTSVPADNLLGEAGRGFQYLMEQLPRERLMAAVHSVANIKRALAVTLDYVKERKAFGKRILDFQNTQFKLAECKTEATIAKVFVDRCVESLLDGKLDAVTASMAKYWVTDLENKIADTCLQFFGGYGYMEEDPIARMFCDARVQRIYGGTNEIMKVLIARSL